MQLFIKKARQRRTVRSFQLANNATHTGQSYKVYNEPIVNVKLTAELTRVGPAARAGHHGGPPTSPMLISASVYWRPFWTMLMSAAGGTRAPFMLLCAMCDSMPNV